MKLSVKSSTLKNNAKMMLAGRFYSAIFILIFYHLFSFFLTSFSNSISVQVSATLRRLFHLSASTAPVLIVSYLIIYLFTALINVFQIGISCFYLNIACNQYYSAFDLFRGSSENFGRAYGLSLVMTLITTVCTLPSEIMIWLFRQNDGVRSDVLISLITLQVVLIAVYVYLWLSLSQVWYIFLDYPDLTVIEILKLSLKIMNGHRKQFFHLQISFLPLFLLTLPTLGLGTFWFTPYWHMTGTLFYLDIMGASEEK